MPTKSICCLLPTADLVRRRCSSRLRAAAAVVITAAAALLSMPIALAVDIFATAVVGQPYGVATIEIPVETPVPGRTLPPIIAVEQTGRILYPISDDVRVDVAPRTRQVAPPARRPLLNRVRGLIRELASDEKDAQQTVSRRVSFLFVGNEPLRVQLAEGQGEIGTYDIVLQNDPATHAKILNQWWTGYTEAARRQIDSADYPPWVENYLVSMLSGRTRLPLPDWYTDTKKDDDELLSTLKLIGGAEGAGEAIFRRAAIGQTSTPLQPSTVAAARFPLPAPPRWEPLYQADNLDGVPVEPLASRVPPECFYIRYGSFENFMWFRDLSDEYGGDISRMVTLRGFENDSSARVERQLSMKTSQLSRMLGPTVIDDQALIGRDLFLGDGASMGVLFKAKNAFLLRTSVNNDRSKVASADDAVTLKEVKVAGRPVSLLSSVDHRVRSFMAVDGDYILVANSRKLIERFLEVGQSGQSLAATSGFRLSRQLMPLEREDTIFAYFSPQMLRGLVSPEYLIELRRRLQAKSDVALVHLARLAAAQEVKSDQPVQGINELSRLGFLPTGFGTRPDGSGVITVGTQVIDTLRGSRGTFLPIADVQIDAVTAEESAWYSQIAQQYTERFPTIDPIMAGIQRERLAENKNVERVTVHAEVAPWDPGKYGKITQMLGPPTRVAMKFAPDDIIAVQAHVASPQIGPPTHLFAAIKDTRPPEPEQFEGILNIYQSLRQLPGYLGAWPQPGALDRLPLGLGRGQPVGPGMSRLLGGLYRYTDGQFSILSFQPGVIQASLPFLAATDARDAAQVRIRAGNLQGSQLEGWVNSQLYDRARDGSASGANFLSMLSRQLRVASPDVADASTQILGAKLQCPLGGQYQYSDWSGRWISTAWESDSPPASAPPEYVAPMMNWFRGANARLTQYADRLVADVVIDIERQ